MKNAGIATSTVLAGGSSLAVSDEAGAIQRSLAGSWLALQRLASLGRADLFDELDELADQCAEAGWDGYDAAPVSPAAVDEARRFLAALPFEAPAPTLGAEPDGDITFEWHAAGRRTLSVSISSRGELHYAASLGPARSYGVEPFLGVMPAPILDLIARTVS